MAAMFVNPGTSEKKENFDFYKLLVLGITQKSIKMKKNDQKSLKLVVFGSDEVRTSIVQSKLSRIHNIFFFQHHAVRDFILLENL